LAKVLKSKPYRRSNKVSYSSALICKASWLTGIATPRDAWFAGIATLRDVCSYVLEQQVKKRATLANIILRMGEFMTLILGKKIFFARRNKKCATFGLH